MSANFPVTTSSGLSTLGAIGTVQTWPILSIPVGREGDGQRTRKGGIDKAKGAVKDAAGAAAGNEKLQAEGKADKAKESAREAAGEVKDAGRKVGDAVKR